jgi:predicted O-methyltransferase YrrM
MNVNNYINYISRYPSAWIGHGIFATELVKIFQPNIIVDLGVDYGFSTFCLAYPQIGEIYGIDWFQGDPHAGHRDTYSLVLELYDDLKRDHNINNVEFIKGDFNEVAKTWDKKIDLLHIDGFHTYEAVKNDYETWSKFCTPDSIILFHDVEEFPGVNQFFSELPGDYKLIRTGSCGLGVFTLSKSKFEMIKNL